MGRYRSLQTIRSLAQHLTSNTRQRSAASARPTSAAITDGSHVATPAIIPQAWNPAQAFNGALPSTATNSAYRTAYTFSHHLSRSARPYSTVNGEDRKGPPTISDVIADPSDALTQEQIERELGQVAQLIEQLVTEAYRLLNEGELKEAEQLLDEGAEKAEESLGVDHPLVPQLWDQVALFYFFVDKCDKALQVAEKAHQRAQLFFGEEGGPVPALMQVRIGAAQLGLGKVTEARQAFEACLASLQQFAEYEVTEDHLVETQAYLHICRIKEAQSPEEVYAITDDIVETTRQLGKAAGARHPVTWGVLREYNRTLDSFLGEDKWEIGLAMFQQYLRMHEALDPLHEQMGILLYQMGSLQYGRGLFEEAQEVMQACLDFAQASGQTKEDMVTIKERLGMIKAKLGRYDEARPMLQSAFDLFTKEFGATNPVSAESAFGLAVCDAWLHHVEMSDEEKDEVMERARGALAQMMSGLEADHLLVQQAAKEQEKLLGLLVKGEEE